jgi:hypothetical protein
LINAFEDLFSVLVPTPNDTQKILISEKIQNLYNQEIKFAQSQFAQDFETDPDIINDPKFFTFSNDSNYFYNQTKNFIVNPENSYQYYMSCSDTFANFIVLTIQTAEDVAAKKAAGRKNYMAVHKRRLKEV